MALKRKYGGTAYRRVKRKPVAKGPAPKALRRKAKRRNYRASYKLSKPFKQVLNKFLDKDKQTHWVTTPIKDQLVRARPRQLPGAAPEGFIYLMPNVHQVAQTSMASTIPDDISTREGSQIRCKSMTLDLTLRMDPSYDITNANLTAIRYKAMIISVKRGGRKDDIESQFFPGLQDIMFREGATPKPWDRFMTTFENPINTEIFTVHDSIEGTLQRGLATGDVTGSAVHTPSNIHNRKMKVHCKTKILRYDTPQSILPTNFAPFLWIGWKAYNGSDWISPIATPEILHMVGNFRMGFDDMS